MRNAARFDVASFRRGMLAQIDAAIARGRRARRRAPAARVHAAGQARGARSAPLSGCAPACSAAPACALAARGPTVLAFFAGGYFDEPRAWAGLVAWAAGRGRAARRARGGRSRRGGWLAVGGLARLAALDAAVDRRGRRSPAAPTTPVRSSSSTSASLLAAALAAARRGSAARGRAGAGRRGAGRDRLRDLRAAAARGCCTSRARSAPQGRLEQPLTYWNAMGELAALGFVLCRAGSPGDAAAPGDALRRAAAAAAAPLGMGLYLTFSRGALFACAAGLIALIVLAPAASSCERSSCRVVARRARGGRGGAACAASPHWRARVGARARGRDRARSARGDRARRGGACSGGLPDASDSAALRAARGGRRGSRSR